MNIPNRITSLLLWLLGIILILAGVTIMTRAVLPRVSLIAFGLLLLPPVDQAFSAVIGKRFFADLKMIVFALLVLAMTLPGYFG